MKRGMNYLNSHLNMKRAQLFIIAAVIIVAIMFSLAAITNYVKGKPKPAAFYDMSNELGAESSQVLDYATYTGEDANMLIENFSSYYANYTSKDIELVFVYGNVSMIRIDNYAFADTGSAGVDMGGGVSANVDTTTRTPETSKITPTSNAVNITIGNDTYNFQLNPGENFFFVIKKEVSGEKHVAAQK